MVIDPAGNSLLATSQEKQPNIIVMLSDDIGWGQVSCEDGYVGSRKWKRSGEHVGHRFETTQRLRPRKVRVGLSCRIAADLTTLNRPSRGSWFGTA